MLKHFFCLSLLGLAVAEQTFFEMDPDFKAIHRELLQADESDQEPEVPQENPAFHQGPTRFFALFDVLKPPKGFLMTVTSPIKLKVFDNTTGVLVDTFKLDVEAQGGIKGSSGVTASVLLVDIGWKDREFMSVTGTSGNKVQVGKIVMKFKLEGRQYTMTELIVKFALVRGDAGKSTSQITSYLKTRSQNGYYIEAPNKLSLSCSDAGMFAPKKGGKNAKNDFNAGLIFPDLQLQIGSDILSDLALSAGIFGPVWDCAPLIPIGLWVGIIITLFFAIICCWGFSMLANINTMDRFDDPKGKSINVPQSD